MLYLELQKNIEYFSIYILLHINSLENELSLHRQIPRSGKANVTYSKCIMSCEKIVGLNAMRNAQCLFDARDIFKL